MRCFAYADESGNSGLRLFGDKQDTFWTGTLIGFSDLDTKYATFHRELVTLSGKEELHGNELGFGRIEKIAGRLAAFIREKKLRFSFVRIFKPYLATTKMFDLAFDSGVNPAVPPQSYAVRHLRLINLLHFSQLLTTSDLNEFWSLFEAQSPDRFGKLLADVRDRVKHTPYDKRSVQILTESLDWASKHPAEVLDPFGERDSPNFVAFTALFDALHSFHRETGHTIGSFVHDEQDQFVPKFVEAFDLISKFQGDETGPLSMASDISPIATFDCSLEIRSSADSFGLQIVDVCLWLAKRVLEQKDVPRGQCATLWKCLIERSYIKEYDFEMLVREIRSGVDLLEQRPLTATQLADAKQTLAKIEATRKKRVALNP
ncbi:MAG: DUF3800 domain-containing protein [Acidobacteriaceae bacterium]|nr:DUF3800 domain-containing protein [Acidobacteriaceae bacterium]